MKTIIATCAFTLFPLGFLLAQSSVIGTTDPIRETDLSFPEQGVIVEIPVKEGQSVTKGQLLAKLNAKVLEASLRMAKIKAASQSGVQSTKANWSLRKRRFEELQRLAKSRSANQDEVARARAEFEIAEADLADAKEEVVTRQIQVEQIEAQIQRHTLVSPFDGIVTRIHREIGEIVQPGHHPVLTLVQLDHLHLTLYLDHTTAEKLTVGQTIPITCTSETSTLHSTDKIPAKVVFISPLTDAASGTTRVKLAIDNSEGRIRSGLKYSVKLTTDET